MSHGGRRFMMAGGGTGGHVFPGLAVVEELRRLRPETEFRWIGTGDRMEARVVPAAGIPFDALDVTWLKGRRGVDAARAAIRLPLAGVSSARRIRAFRPDAVVGLGGFVSGPVCLAAAALGVPVFLLEQNAMPGATNRWLGRVATAVYASWEASTRHFPAGRVRVTGNPVRRAILESAGAPRPIRPDNVRNLLVIGGSQGARALNEGTPDVLAAVARTTGLRLRVRHACGKGNADAARGRWEAAGLDAEVVEFIDDMAAAWRWADLAISRAGATSLAEMTIVGVPSLLVPFPHAADDHQTANATSMVRAGAAVMCAESEWASERPVRLLSPLLAHPEVLDRMRAASRNLGRPDAGVSIAADLLDRIDRGGTGP